MSKKTNQKKKINIKLNIGESYFIENLDVLLHIQRTYARAYSSQFSEEEKIIFEKATIALSASISNAHNANDSNYEEEH